MYGFCGAGITDVDRYAADQPEAAGQLRIYRSRHVSFGKGLDHPRKQWRGNVFVHPFFRRHYYASAVPELQQGIVVVAALMSEGFWNLAASDQRKKRGD